MSEPLVDQLYPIGEADRAYLAAILGREDANEVLWQSNIEPRHMEVPHHAKILEVMIAIRDRQERVNYLSVADELDMNHEAIMWHLNDRYANPQLVEMFAEQIIRRYRRRAVSDAGAVLTEVASTSAGSDLDGAVEDAVALMAEAPTAHTLTPSSFTDRVFGERPPETAHPTPWPSLTSMIGGFRNGGLYTIAGETGSGKSALALQVAYTLGLYGKCLYFTMEMTRAEQEDRVIAQQCGISLDLVERQMFPDGPILERVEQFTQRNRSQLVFDDRAGITVSEIRRTALGLGPSLSAVVVDQLTLVDHQGHKGENKTDELARTTRALKIMATDLQVPVVMLSQLNREASKAMRPTRHHLLSSTAIANDSNVLLLLHRPDPMTPTNLVMIVDKNRQGEPGETDLVWEGAFVRAMDYGMGG